MKTFTLGQSKSEVMQMLPEKVIKMVQLGSKKVCVVNTGSDFFVFDPHCPHRMAFLGNGKINNQKEIICPLHEYRFDLETGQVKSGDCADLKVYKADLTETGLEIEL